MKERPGGRGGEDQRQEGRRAGGQGDKSGCRQERGRRRGGRRKEGKWRVKGRGVEWSRYKEG